MFLLERFFIYSMVKAPWGKDWVRSQFWLHPNFISRCRYPMGVISFILWHLGVIYYEGAPGNPWQYIAVYFFSFWIITDVTDGSIARHFDLHSIEGQSIDPLSDKLLILPPLFYLSYFDLIPFYLVLLFLTFDIVGQFSRYFIKKKAANLFGKAKTFLAVITLVLITMQEMYFPEAPGNIYYATLVGAIILGFCSMFFRVIPSYWYANILSILNLSCGLLGMALVIVYNQPGLAFAAVFIGQFLDLFDGRAADRWGSTPKGELFDDWADGTNFGGTISLIIYASFDGSLTGIILGFIHLSTMCFRLIRFVFDKRKTGVEGGVEVFKGLPSPAAALVSGSVALLDTNINLRIALIVGTSLLMVSKIPYLHFGRVMLQVIPKIIKVILLTLMLLSVLMGFRSGNHQILYWTAFILSFCYVLFGIDFKGIIKKRQVPESS
ncbi:MAG: CDP-diacylglycerol--glycerol-3-phosphate 3-phosphatidyltransferase [Proteobacteria bacterium]|nr:CDP-diacylglycerol--glycerol-3-phosphate 3-phosphatidyltransferase [Pseudomonadota bacterium]